jgi:hypothetical protein
VPDFLTEPIVIFAIIYALSRLFKGKKKDASTPSPARKPADASVNAEEARRRAVELQAKAKPFDQRLEELARRFEQKLAESGAKDAVLNTAGEPIVAVGEPMRAEGSSLEAAALETGSLEIGTIEQVLPRESFDEKATTVDYDLETDAFAFHPAVRGSDGDLFHLDSFSAFRDASGHRVEALPEEAQSETVSEIQRILGSREELRQAFVLSEILGRPRSLRGRRIV